MSRRRDCAFAAVLTLGAITSACSGEPEAAPRSTTSASQSSAAAVDHGGWILAQSHGGGLTMISEDGFEDRDWVPELPGGYAWHADFSPDGTWVAFEQRTSDGGEESDHGIWVARSDGSEPRQIVGTTATYDVVELPAWSPDGKQIAFEETGPRLPRQPIVVVDAFSGREVVRITAPALVGPSNVRWSPDGHHLAAEVQQFTEGEPGEFELVSRWIGVADLRDPHPSFEAVTPLDVWAQYPDWSPDGTQISFVAGNQDPLSHHGRPANLYVVEPDGHDLRQLTHQTAGDAWIFTPSWEPDAFLVTLVDPPTGGHAFGHLGWVSTDGRTITSMADRLGRPVPGVHARLQP